MNYRILIILLFAITTGLLSCKNKDYPLPVSLPTYLNVVNATADTLDYAINFTRQNNLSDIYSGGATYYQSVISGTQKYQFKKAGSPNILFSTTYTLDTGKYYSIFIGGETVDKTFLVVDNNNQASAIVYADTTHTTAAVRFINASPTIGSLNFVINKGDTVNIKGSTFESVSPYMLAKGALDSIKIYQPNVAKPIVDTAFTLVPGSTYTIFAKGVLNGKGNSAFSAVLLNTLTVLNN